MQNTSPNTAPPPARLWEDGRHRRSKRNKAKILQACREIMQDGWFRPTTAAVASRAGVSLRTVFVHYKDVETMYLEAASDQLTKELMFSKIIGATTAGLVGLEFIMDRVVQVAILGRTAQ